MLQDIAEDEFPFSTGITGIDQTGNVLALDELGKEFQSIFGTFDGTQVEMGWYHGQVGKRPLSPFHLVFFRCRNFEKVSNRRGKNVGIVLVIVPDARESP